MILAPLTLFAQEQPLSVTGTFATGYYATTTRGEANQDLKFVPFGARFEMSGYVVSPDLLNFTAEPELNLGPQASEAGFQGGNGIRLGLSFLRRSITPVTFRYTNVQVEDVYFGSLSQVSGYTLKNRTKEIGLSWEFKPHHGPETIVDWGTGSVDSKPGIPEISDYTSHGNHINVNTTYEKWGWDLQGFVHRQEQESNLLASQTSGANTGSLRETVLQYQGSARRGFLGDSEFYVDGGSQSTSSLLFTLPIDLTTHYTNANLRLRQRRRWRTSLRAGYSSNLASQMLAVAAGSLAGPGAVAPDGNILMPFSHGISNYSLNGITNVTLSHGFGLYASGERSAIVSATQEGPLSADYFTTTAGITYARRFGWGSVSGEYAREFGEGSITGQSGTIQGQNYVASFQHGNAGGLQFDTTLHGSDQSVDNAQPFSNRNFSLEGSVGDRIYRDFSLRLGGGWQWGAIVNSANEFRTNGYTARLGIDHPRFQINAALSDSLSNSLPFYNQILSGAGIGSVVIAPLEIIPSDYRALNFTFHATPIRKLEISALWTRSLQHLDGILNNDFQLMNLLITYHFRRIRMEAGFIRSNQIFANFPNTLRERLYLRFSRTAKLL